MIISPEGKGGYYSLFNPTGLIKLSGLLLTQRFCPGSDKLNRNNVQHLLSETVRIQQVPPKFTPLLHPVISYFAGGQMVSRLTASVFPQL